MNVNETLRDLHAQQMQDELVRRRGRIRIFKAVNEGEDPAPIQNYFLRNNAAFASFGLDLHAERTGVNVQTARRQHATTIFEREVAIAELHKEGKTIEGKILTRSLSELIKLEDADLKTLKKRI